jgi:ADP-ribosylglycohydrolase
MSANTENTQERQRELERAQGLILGLAIGDALGRPAEFLSWSQIQDRFGPAGIQDLPESAIFTDDTQMTLALAEALVSQGQADVDTLMGEVVRRFIDWKNGPDNDRGPGITCMRAISRLEHGTSWTESGVRHSKGCGSAMRVAPVGYLYQHDANRLRTVASATGLATHAHPTANAACIAAAYLIKLALDGVKPEEYAEELADFVAGLSDELDMALERVVDALDWPDQAEAMRTIGEGWVGEETVALALYCLLRSPDDYRAVVLRAANSDGDSDSIACIAGGLAGVRLGIGAIPAEWSQRIERREYLLDLANRLAERKLGLVAQTTG